MFINVFTESGLYKRSRTGINYPYIFPERKEIEDKIPTVTIDTFTRHRRRAVSRRRRQGRSTCSRTRRPTCKGRHTFKAGIVDRVLGRRRLRPDQRQLDSGRHEQPERPVRVPQQRDGADRASASRTWRSASSPNYAEIGERAFTKWRALATDIFVQDSWKPTQQPDRRRWRPLGDLAAVVFDDEQHRQLRSALLRSGHRRRSSIRRRAGWSAAIATTASSLPGDGFEGDGNDLVVAQDPRVQALFRGEPRGFSETHYNVFEPRLGVSYAINDKTIARVSAGVFHNRVTLNDSTLLGGNPPFQPMVERRRTAASTIPAAPAAAIRPAVRACRGRTSSSSTRRRTLWSAGVQREVPFGFVVDATYVGRRGLYLQRERNINQLHAGHDPGEPGRATSRRCVPTWATARSASPRTRAARSTTACSSAPTAATATA